jgi:protein SCO1/2
MFLKYSHILVVAGLLLGVIACQRTDTNTRLPIFGERETTTKMVNGQQVVDTIYHSIPPFRLLNQDSIWVDNATFKGKIYVADFFFTTCPSICPLMKSQLLRVAERYKNNPKVGILSHTVDPEHDTIPVLKEYAQRLSARPEQWNFVWGNRDTIYNLAQAYFTPRPEADVAVPGGFNHSGLIVLVDTKGRVRGAFQGTSAVEVDKLLVAMERLLQEKE